MDTPTNTSKFPAWDPRENFPFDVEKLDFAGKYGVLLALIQHQQRKSTTNFKRNNKTFVELRFEGLRSTPHIFFGDLLRHCDHYHHYEHGPFIDALVRDLSIDEERDLKDIPKRLSRNERADVTRVYRLASNHLTSSSIEHSAKRTAWEAERKKEDLLEEEPEDGNREGDED